jgi:cell volume regulation protein A
MSSEVAFDLAIVLISAGIILAAAISGGLSERIRVPAPALFLIFAAILSQIFPRLQTMPAELGVQIVSIALIFVLFDGGMEIGWREFRASAGAIVWVGVVGTIVTAGAVTMAAHLLFGFDWHLALLMGAAISPTDPAVVFSVLGGREIIGRSGTILKGESGANDPVGIALMVVLLSAGTGRNALWTGIGAFLLQMVVGAVVGALGGLGVRWLMGRWTPQNPALGAVATLACAPLIYGTAALLHGSGFLAVLFAGIIVGDMPVLREVSAGGVRAVSAAVSSLGEIVAFAVLGLSVSLSNVLKPSNFWVGIGLAVLLIVVIRPLLVGVVVSPLRLRVGEKVFILLAGLRGAVPILLALLVVAYGLDDSHRFYDIVFVVVLVSVVVQGGLVPTMARWCSVPMSARGQPTGGPTDDQGAVGAG